jgi:hypothetical protein
MILVAQWNAACMVVPSDEVATSGESFANKCNTECAVENVQDNAVPATGA